MLRRNSPIRDSLLASLCGYVAGVLFLWLAAVYLAGYRPAGTLVNGPLLLFFSAFGSFVGWIIFLLPLAKRFPLGLWLDRPSVLMALGATLGFFLTALETYPIWLPYPGFFRRSTFMRRVGQ